MRIRKLFVCCILFVFSIVLSSCTVLINNGSNNSSSPVYDMTTLERSLNSFENVSNVEMDYSITISSEGNYFTVNSKLIIMNNYFNQSMYLQTYTSSETMEMYYVNGYLYTEMNGEYSIVELPNYDLQDETPLPELDLDKVSSSLETKVESSQIIYTLTVNDDELKSYVESLIGETLDLIDINMKYEVRVNKLNNQVQAFKIVISASSNEMSFGVEIDIDVVATGSRVSLYVPYTVTQRIEAYKDEQNQEPEPQPIDYENTSDGIVTYHKFTSIGKVAYDDTTNQIIILNNGVIEVYDADTFTYKYSVTSLLRPTNFDVDNGKLVITYETNHFTIYDLTTNNSSNIQTQIVVSEIVIDQDMVIYADGDQWCDVVFHNINTNDLVTIHSLYNPKLTLNRNDHIVYVIETGISSTQLNYYNSQSGNLISSYRYDDYNNNGAVKFDGKYVHTQSLTLNRYDATLVNKSKLNRSYTSKEGFTPSETLYDVGSISFVQSVANQNKIGVFDNKNDELVYEFAFNGKNVIYINDGKFIVAGNEKLYVAKIDVKLINEELLNDMPIELPFDEVTLTSDGVLKQLNTNLYSSAVSDGNYLYTINDKNYVLNVYDVKTLNKVFSQSFTSKPTCFDVGEGKLVVGLGDKQQFRIYDISTWEYETINTLESVYSIVIYKDEIIYAEIDQHCSVYVYDMKTKTHVYFGYSGYYISMAVNKEDGIIYFGDRRSSGCDLAYFDLNTKTQIYNRDFGSNNSPVMFDGNFVHYQNKVFDSMTGIQISNNGVARLYNTTFTVVKTIADNNEISVFLGLDSNGEYVTVIYDLLADKIIYSNNGISSNAYIMDDIVIVLNNSSNIIKSIDISM